MSSRFSSRSPLRQFEIRLKGGSLYVNAHYLAEMSPYFHQLCFTECFSESKNGVVIMEDMDYNEVLAMLEYVCPDKNYEMRRNITDNNLAALIHCSYRFQIPFLTSSLKNFLENEIDKQDCHLKAETLVDALLESDFANYSSYTTRGLYRKLASHGEEAVRLALKDLPAEVTNKLMQETAHYLRVSNPLQVRHQSAYHWNNFSKRMFY